MILLPWYNVSAYGLPQSANGKPRLLFGVVSKPGPIGPIAEAVETTPKGSLFVLVKCDQCGKVIDRKKYDIEHKQHLFCSRKCYGAWRSENLSGKNSPLWTGTRRVDAICQQCSKAFRPLRGDVERGYGKFCSRACYTEWMRENQRGENHPCWVGDYIEVTCEWCGKKFTQSRYRVENQNSRFCSRECLGKWHSEFMSGENCPTWQGGLSFEPYGRDFNSELKEKVRTRDGRRCMMCGMLANDNGRKLDIHHIDYDKQNNDESNLISLCMSCHRKTNNNRDAWQSMLQRVIGECYGYS